MVGRMEKAIRTPVVYIRSDSGSEFKGETQDVMKELGIRHKFVKSGNRIENANKNFQKIWYRLMRLGRGDLTELDPQAVAIFNNTKSTVNGFTPLEALDVPDQILAKAFNDDRKRVAKYKAVSIKKGDRVRYLLLSEVGKHGKALAYKSYRGKHWSAEVYTVAKVSRYEVYAAKPGVEAVYDEKYYVASDWRHRDKLLLVPGVDALTRDAVNARHRLKKKDWVDKIGHLAE